jgi:hypothetical protein
MRFTQLLRFPILRYADAALTDCGKTSSEERENSVVPPGLKSFFQLFRALKRWAKLGRPSGAGFRAAF